jgi:Domain of unknown function (DUF6894)
MPGYYFHLKSPSRPVRDKTGVELSGLEAAHWHAMRLAYRLREHAAETGEDWMISVADESGAAPLAVLPSAVPMLRKPTVPPEQLAERPAATYSRCRPALTASAPENPEPRP